MDFDQEKMKGNDYPHEQADDNFQRARSSFRSSGQYRQRKIEPLDEGDVVLSIGMPGGSTEKFSGAGFTHQRIDNDPEEHTFGELVARWNESLGGIQRSREIPDPVLEKKPNSLGWLDVKSFGALGDGMHDDTTSIQNTINAAANENGVVYFPPGTYLIRNTLRICDPADPARGTSLTVLGSGSDSTFILARDCNGILAKSMIEDSGSDPRIAGRRALSISGFTMLTTSSEFTGLTLYNAFISVSDIRLCGHDLENNYWRTAIKTIDMWYSTLDRVRIQSAKSFEQEPRGLGISMNYSVNNVISNSNFRFLEEAIKLTAEQNPRYNYVCEGLRIVNNNILSCHKGIRLLKGLAVAIQGNIIDQIRKVGIIISGKQVAEGGSLVIRGDHVIEGNYIGSSKLHTADDWRGIIVFEGVRNRIVGNSLYSHMGRGIGLIIRAESTKNVADTNQIVGFGTNLAIYGSNNTISSNVLTGGGRVIVFLHQAASQNLFANNQILGNPYTEQSEPSEVGIQSLGDNNIYTGNAFTGIITGTAIYVGGRYNIVTSNNYGENGRIDDHGGGTTVEDNNV